MQSSHFDFKSCLLKTRFEVVSLIKKNFLLHIEIEHNNIVFFLIIILLKPFIIGT